MKYKIIVINGPNLNLLGEREKEKYGDISLKKIETECLDFAAKNNIELTFKQSNIEGEIVSLIQECRNKYSGLIINAAGYTHTSVSILDALMVLIPNALVDHFDQVPALCTNLFLSVFENISCVCVKCFDLILVSC